MATVQWVHAVRGKDNKVSEEHEEQLQGIRDFFEQYRLKGPNPDPLKNTKVLELPGKGAVRDWFVPFLAEPNHDRFVWLVNENEELDTICEHLGKLFRLGIPSFLLEGRRNSLMKLFMPLEAYVKDDCLQLIKDDEESRIRFWKELKEGILKFAVQTMAEAAAQMFSINETTRGHRPGGPDAEEKSEVLVAVFDASGYSPDANRWKLSFRVCFIEIAVQSDDALEARDLFISRLDTAWDRLKRAPQEERCSWVETVEPIQRPASSADSQCSFWASILDEQPFKPKAQHRLVFCDALRGVREPPGEESTASEEEMRRNTRKYEDAWLPENRPLLPYGLYKVSVSSVSAPCQQPMEESLVRNLSDADWSKLGSVSTLLERKTLRSHTNFPRYSHRASTAAVAKARPAPASAAATDVAAATVRGNGAQLGPWPTSLPAWNKYITPEGAPYFYNPQTKETQWTMPIDDRWKEYRHAELNCPYYHCAALGQTVWELPAGACLVPEGPLQTLRR